MPGELTAALQSLGTVGPKGGNPDKATQAEARRAEFNAPTDPATGLPGLHRMVKPEGFVDKATPGNQKEQAWHRMAAFMLMAGRTNSEIAAAADVTVQAVSNLRSQRWFQQLLATLANETGEDIVGLLAAEAVQSVETLVAIRDDADAPVAQRLKAAQTLLEQAHGKPTQKIISATSVSHVDPKQEMDELYAELRSLRERNPDL